MKNSSNKKLIIQIVVCVCTILVLLGTDIATKLAVHFHFNGVEGSRITVIEDFFWIHLTYNRGALASFLADVSAGRVILSIISIIGSIVSIFYLVKNFKKLNIFYRIALYLFIPGCMGNMIDRVGIYNTEGVIDFLSFKLFGFYYFPIFNFADMCLTVSIALFFIYYIFFDKKKDDEVEKVLNSPEEEIKTIGGEVKDDQVDSK